MFDLIRKDEEVIFGNKEYEPLVEVSRSWIDLDETTEEISLREYIENKPYKYVEEE